MEEPAVSEFKLLCFGESGNSYKPALMLEACRLDWQPVWVDFFNGATRSAEFRHDVNLMGEAPVLEHGALRLTQSGVILDYLAEVTRKHGPKSEEERREIWRWILFDNHKFTASLATLRFLINFAKTGETPVTEFLRARAIAAIKIVDAQLAANPYIVGKRLTIADFSLCGYVFYGEELTIPLEPYGNLLKWMDRIRAIPGWKHPYELMPRSAS
jgi:glutathione S-transferase